MGIYQRRVKSFQCISYTPLSTAPFHRRFAPGEKALLLESITVPPLSSKICRFSEEVAWTADPDAAEVGGYSSSSESCNAKPHSHAPPPFPSLPRRCEKIPFSPPPCPSPVEGEGISSCISIYLPSPLAGDGRVRGNILIFLHLPRGEEAVKKFDRGRESLSRCPGEELFHAARTGGKCSAAKQFLVFRRATTATSG